MDLLFPVPDCWDLLLVDLITLHTFFAASVIIFVRVQDTSFVSSYVVLQNCAGRPLMCLEERAAWKLKECSSFHKIFSTGFSLFPVELLLGRLFTVPICKS